MNIFEIILIGVVGSIVLVVLRLAVVFISMFVNLSIQAILRLFKR